MSHSTHVGFNCPRIAFCPCDWRPLHRFAVGVGHSRRLLVRPERTIANRSPRPPRSPSVARGVGHMPRSTALTITVSEVIVFRGPPGILAFIARCASGVFPSSWATGVGHNPDSVPLVRGADGGSRYAVPVRVIPERGQLAEYVSKPPSKESCRVLHECVGGSYLAKDLAVCGPKPAFVLLDKAAAGNTDRLAGGSSGDKVNRGSWFGSPPFDAGADVVMLGYPRPVRVENDATVGIDFHLTNRGHAGAFEAELEPANAREQGQHVHVPPPSCPGAPEDTMSLARSSTSAGISYSLTAPPFPAPRRAAR